MVAMALTACSPETFDGPDQNGIPSVSGVDINLNVDQSVNQATFDVQNLPKGTYALWTVNGNIYSTLNPMTISSPAASRTSTNFALALRPEGTPSTVNWPPLTRRE